MGTITEQDLRDQKKRLKEDLVSLLIDDVDDDKMDDIMGLVEGSFSILSHKLKEQ